MRSIHLMLLVFFVNGLSYASNEKKSTSEEVVCDLQVSQVWNEGSFVYSTNSPIKINKQSGKFAFLYEHSAVWNRSEGGIAQSPNINNFMVQIRVIKKDDKEFLEVSFVVVKYDFRNNIKTKTLYPLKNIEDSFDVFTEHTFGPERMAYSIDKAEKITFQSDDNQKSHQTSMDDFFEGKLEHSSNPGIVLSGICKLSKHTKQEHN